MDSPKPGVDLEKELTCSICADLLYQPLTLLDCLHTFCGACLKAWFGWQAMAAENAPTPPAPDSPVFTCPSCRAPVRDTRHNATVATLLDMFQAANPDKGKDEDERAEASSKYRPGDKVLPKLNIPERTPEQRRLDEEDRRLIAEVRAQSLREAVAAATGTAAPAPDSSSARLQAHVSRPRRRGADEAAGGGSRDSPRTHRPSASRSRDPSTDGDRARERRRDREREKERERNRERGRDSDRDREGAGDGDGDNSSTPANRSTGRAREARAREREREQSRRHVAEAENRLRAEQTIMLQPERRQASGDRRQRRSTSRQRSADSSEPRRRYIEHQSSIRSLLSSSDPDSLDRDREVEEFARRIQEEGLLDGLDLNDIDLNTNNELSRKVTEAYRRWQREKTRDEASTRLGTGSTVPRQSAVALNAPPQPGEQRSSSAGRQRRHSHSTPPAQTHARSSSAASQTDERSRRGEQEEPVAGSTQGGAPLLEVRDEPRRRRRTTSGGRSATAPTPGSGHSSPPSNPQALPQQQPRVAARAQTDLTLPRPGGGGTSDVGRPALTEARSSSTPSVPSAAAHADSVPSSGRVIPFNVRAPGGIGATPPSQTSASFESSSGRGRRTARPADIGISQPPLTESPPLRSPGYQQPQQQQQTHQQTHQLHHQYQHQPQRPSGGRAQLYQEPCISCSRCKREHIEYEVHYNCRTCDHGDWNVCLDCYRRGKGCKHWFGFGYAGWSKWERLRQAAAAALQADDSNGDAGAVLEPPHVLTANRYLPPMSALAAATQATGAADGRRTVTNEDPLERLQSGTFCARCEAWTNDCWWRCAVCNDGDWGFCNGCVNRGLCCTHPLLPLAYQPSANAGPGMSMGPNMASANPMPTPPHSPSFPGGGWGRSMPPPASAATAAGPTASPAANGSFKVLTFTTRCDVCRNAIAPSQSRYHCFWCTSTLVAESRPGDYDVCQTCYAGLVASREVSVENGPAGWRRCPQQGHRMVMVGFQDGRAGWRRVTVRDLVGGRRLKVEAVPAPDQGGRNPQQEQPPPAPQLQRWSWYDRDEKRMERLVTVDVRATATATAASSTAAAAPPPGKGAATVTTELFPADGGSGWIGQAKWAWYPNLVDGADELLFPQGAEIREIEDVNGEWFHGIYMGAKGMFPAPYIRMLEAGGSGVGSGTDNRGAVELA